MALALENEKEADHQQSGEDRRVGGGHAAA
jgi:hypothetical protein